ncbi:MAG: hypothetical protein KKF98_12540, partial [Bacteroidetes bacterium]|nr:hypothetical protein [Bacteroidota bacterium]
SLILYQLTLKLKKMKTLGIIFAFMMVFSTNYATGINNNALLSLEEDSYINDIPFNTGKIADEYIYNQAISIVFEMEEETYIDDIPFDTECISADCLYEKAMLVVFELPEEETIPDAPAAFLKL